MFSALLAIGLGGVAAGVTMFFPSTETQCIATETAESPHEKLTKDYDNIAFVNLDPLVVSLGPGARAKYLKVSITLETKPSDINTVEHLRPRLRDLLNSYLRAVEEKDLTDPAAMTRIRSHLLRRLQIATPPGAISDVLITDFVLN